MTQKGVDNATKGLKGFGPPILGCFTASSRTRMHVPSPPPERPTGNLEVFQ
jgi:hypothetical protein